MQVQTWLAWFGYDVTGGRVFSIGYKCVLNGIAPFNSLFRAFCTQAGNARKKRWRYQYLP